MVNFSSICCFSLSFSVSRMSCRNLIKLLNKRCEFSSFSSSLFFFVGGLSLHCTISLPFLYQLVDFKSKRAEMLRYGEVFLSVACISNIKRIKRKMYNLMSERKEKGRQKTIPLFVLMSC